MQKIPGISLYHQIKQDLFAKVEPLAPGTKIETEQQLSAYYNVSRGTVRQAVNDLVIAGLLVKVQGCGTFRTRTSAIRQSYFVNKSFTQQILDSGHTPGIANITLSEIPARGHIAQYLQLPEGAPVFRLTRVRLSDSDVLGFASACLRKELVPGLKPEDLQMSLIDMLVNRFGHVLTNRRGYCSASIATPEIAKILSLREKAPILQIEHVSCAQDGTPLFVDVTQLTSAFTLVLESSQEC